MIPGILVLQKLMKMELSPVLLKNHPFPKVIWRWWAYIKLKKPNLCFPVSKNNSSRCKSYDEFSLTDALECMIQRGLNFKSFKVHNWFDCGKKETLLESNATLLKKIWRQCF